jgi:formate dehydrogenase iron-sulfur subunit
VAVAAEGQRRGIDLRIVRNGSRGLYWLEPLIEVMTPGGRIGYGPVSAADVPGLFDAGVQTGASHRLRIGVVERHPYLESQQRLTFARVGVIDPVSLPACLAHGGYQGLERALTLAPDDAAQPTTTKYIVCNADEGDSGTFADRMIMEGDPFLLIEGMIIAGLAVGATRGFIYLRSEYPHARRVLDEAIAAARASGYLGADVCGSGRAFDLSVRLGAGAYVCGEETSMLESLEGRRGEVRVRPPLPAIEGLFGRPTVVNNVMTLASVPAILAQGAAGYRAYGAGASRGTLPLQLAGNVRHGGLVERAFGLTLRELLYDYGGGSASGRPLRAVQIGGPLGAWLPAAQFDTPLTYEALAGVGAMLGHGGVVAFDDTVDMCRMARHAMEFCARESCGKCAPCRIGSTRGVLLLDRIARGIDSDRNLALLDELCNTLQHGSLCGLGGMTPWPVQSALRHFPGDFRKGH